MALSYPSANILTNNLVAKDRTTVIAPPGKSAFLPQLRERFGEGGWRTKGYFKESRPGLPLLSIVTIVYNGAEVLEQTIASVLDQHYPNMEYIVIDGGSSDGTRDIIARNEGVIDYWVSERDGGIYDASNRASAAALGAGLLFMNSGDYFQGLVLGDNLTIPCFLEVQYRDFFGRTRRVKPRNHRLGMPTSHQGMVFENRDIQYDLTFKVSGDYDYFLRHGYTNQLPLNRSSGWVHYDNTGFSNQNYRLRNHEAAQIIQSNFGQVWAGIFRLRAAIKSLIKRLRPR